MPKLCWAEAAGEGAGLWGASLLRDAGGGIDGVLPAPGSARDVIPPCQTKAELSARGRLDLGYPRAPTRALRLLPTVPCTSPGTSSRRIKAHLLSSRGLTRRGAAAEAEPTLPPRIACFAARSGVVEPTSRQLIPLAAGAGEAGKSQQGCRVKGREGRGRGGVSTHTRTRVHHQHPAHGIGQRHRIGGCLRGAPQGAQP